METDIINYIKDGRAHGLQDREIKQNLLDVGWDSGQVEDSFNFVKIPEKAPESQPQVQTPVKQAVQQANPQPQNPAKPATPVTIAQVSQAPVVSLSDNHFENPPAKKSKAVIIIGAVIVVLALLGSGGYFAYGYFFPSPSVIWNKALKAAANRNKIATLNFKLSYSDPGLPAEDPKDPNQKFSFSLNGSSYGDVTNTSSPVFSTDLTFAYTAGDKSDSRKLKIMYENQVLYIDLGSITELSTLAGQPLNWLKLDFNALKQFASSTPQGAEFLSQLNSNKASQEKAKKDVEALMKGKQLVTVEKLLGTETVSNTTTYHLQNKFNKQLIKDIFNKIVDDSAEAQANIPYPAFSQALAKQWVSNIVDKMDIAKFETWVGKKDFQIYKISLEIKFPGVASWADSADALNPLASARAKARDAKRMADMRQMASALELYFNDHNGYPAGQNGVPAGISPAYAGLVVPTAPSPSDGTCSDYYNSYWYTPSGTPITTNGLVVYPSYDYTFCLGQDTGGFKAGIIKMGPNGMIDNIPCSGNPENCKKTSGQQAATTAPTQQANINFELTYSDFGKKQTLTPPKDSLDVVQFIKDKLNSMGFSGEPTNAAPLQQGFPNDIKRLSDIRKLAAAQELYFNDSNQYPKSLNDLVPKYIPVLPIAPTPADGACTQSDNSYSYKLVNANKYEIGFCLGAASSGYSGGKHKLSEAGIQ